MRGHRQLWPATASPGAPLPDSPAACDTPAVHNTMPQTLRTRPHAASLRDDTTNLRLSVGNHFTGDDFGLSKLDAYAREGYLCTHARLQSWVDGRGHFAGVLGAGAALSRRQCW